MPYKNGRFYYPFPNRPKWEVWDKPVATAEPLGVAIEITESPQSIIELNLDLAGPVEMILTINGQRVQVKMVPPG